MKRSKKLAVLFFGFLCLFVFSFLAINTMAWNSEVQTCSNCHNDTGQVSLTLVNSTTLWVNKSTNFTLAMYTSTSLTGGGNLTIRFVIRSSDDDITPPTFTPEMEDVNSGIRDNDINDPDGTDDQIGNVGAPAIIKAYNVPNADITYIITIFSCDGGAGAVMDSIVLTVNVGAGGQIETWFEWFLRTQMPLIIIIIVITSICVVLSVVLQGPVSRKLGIKKEE